MARQIGKLTSLSVRNAKRRGLYGDGGGLFLQVGATGAKSWIFRWKQAGKFRVMGLGPVHTVSLAEARDKALACRKLRLEGIDPIEERRARRAGQRLEAAKAMTFRQCAEAHINVHKAGWGSRSLCAWEGTLGRYAYPVIGNLPVQAIDVALVMKVVEPIWSQKPETGNRVRGRVESVLDWASARGYRVGDNPARWRGLLEQLLPRPGKVRPVEHRAALPYIEMGAFMAELRAQEGVPARALEFAILTAARTGEVIGARWGEINIAQRLWTVPAHRMKAGKEHRVPLSDRAIVIVNQMLVLRSNEFVFPGGRTGRPLSNMSLLMLLRRMNRRDLTAHGFRSTFRDWAAEMTAFPGEVAEMALAHTVSDRVEAAYRRGDLFQKRRQLAEAWAQFCAAPASTGEVVPIRAGAVVE